MGRRQKDKARNKALRNMRVGTQVVLTAEANKATAKKGRVVALSAGEGLVLVKWLKESNQQWIRPEDLIDLSN